MFKWENTVRGTYIQVLDVLIISFSASIRHIKLLFSLFVMFLSSTAFSLFEIYGQILVIADNILLPH